MVRPRRYIRKARFTHARNANGTTESCLPILIFPYVFPNNFCDFVVIVSCIETCTVYDNQKITVKVWENIRKYKR